MTLYKELGVRENASREEIRAAYLRLAKELHPDKVHNDQGRRAAEERMSHLNRIMETLGDEDRRRQYNEQLASKRTAADRRLQQALLIQVREVGRWAEPAPRHWFGWTGKAWATAAIVLLTGTAGLASLLLMWDPPPGSGTRAPRSADALLSETERHAATVHDSARRVFRRAPEPKRRAWADPASGPFTASSSRDEGTNPDNREPSEDPLVAEAMAAMKAPLRAAITEPVTPSPAKAPAATPPATSETAEPLQSPSNRGWSGSWRYSPNAGGALMGNFSPLNIEMRLEQDGSRLHGVYKAEYSVAGAETSGKVDLKLDGLSYGNDWMRGMWSGNDGAHGQFELKRMSDGKLQMSWWTTKFGHREALASGSARLVETER